ncbi:microtubule associated protein-domain-containing protein [Coprinopsis sp. MPI-PUGE-AT-0042]|nr:microtubule associated protein-domain-containing protein [Coprinopsis sp. MPI-PUGE-AT-0042]
MHFSKTYAQILEGLPPGLRDNAIQYRQLKKIINQVVSELSSLGLSPELLQELIVPNGSAQDPSSPPVSPPTSPDSQADFSSLSSHGSIPEADHTSSTITLGQLDLLAAAEAASHPFRLADLDPLLFNQARVKYEVVEHSDRLEPHLRLWVTLPDAPSVPTPPAEPCFEEVEDLVQTWRQGNFRMSSTPPTGPTTTPTVLLNSLHSHLQSPTQLLPALPAQLGLSPSALEDELKDLQNQLIQGVERRVDVRWKEVEERVAKYTDVEVVYMRHTKALGGNVKSTGTTLGELRKEQWLPRRFDLVTETLGNACFAMDVLEPTAAASVGDAEMDGIDSNALRDVTLERFLRLEKKLVRDKAEVHLCADRLASQRTGHSTRPRFDGHRRPFIQHLCSRRIFQPTNVGWRSFPCPNTNSPTNGMVSMLFQGEPSSSSSSQPHLESEDNYQRIFDNFVARFEQADEETLQSNPSIPIGLENVEPSLRLIEWAQAQHSALEEVKRKREAHIQAMYDQLEGLWRRLGVDESDMDAFVDMNRGSTEDMVWQYEEELNRMLELRQERIGQFVESAREEIGQLWDDLMVGEHERADLQFLPMVRPSYDFTEELLRIHEAEIRKLREERRLKAPLLARIKKLFKICEEEKELTAAASDQTRLPGRGRDPGRLLCDEKMRKPVQKEKPRLEQDLVAALPQWEQETGMLFLVYGESMIQALNQTISQQEQENESRPGRPGRSGSVPARANTSTSPTTASTSNSTSTGFVPGSQARLNSGKQAALGHGRVPGSTTRATPATGGRATRSTSGLGSIQRTTGGVAGMVAKRFPSDGHAALVPSHTGSSSTGEGAEKLGMDIMKKASRAKRESFKPRPSLDRVEMAKMGSYGGFGGGGVRKEDED